MSQICVVQCTLSLIIQLHNSLLNFSHFLVDQWFTNLTEDPLCTLETNHQTIEDMHGMVEENKQSYLNEQVNREYRDFTECWFHTTIRSHHSFIIHHFLASSSKQLSLHNLDYIKFYLSNQSMNVFLHL